MDRYRRRIAMLSEGAQLGCPVRRRIVDLGEAGEHRDLCLGVAQRISPGQPPALAYRAESSGKLSAGTRRTMSDERKCRTGSVPGRCTPG
jgi:hypothetical protein